MNLLSYILNAINVFDSDKPHHQRFDAQRFGRSAWTWAKKHPEWASAALVAVALLVLYGWLFL